MEGIPRIKMIHFPLKEIYDPVDLDVLKKYISEHYDESPADYEQEFTELQNLRKAACAPPHDITGLNSMKRYFAQLQLLRGRFPMEEGEACAISFSWEDVYQKMPVVSADIRFEEMCTLFNIGALHSRLGAREPRADSESMKVACTHFQCAAWAFQRIVDLAGAHVAWTPDCEPSLLRFKSTLMLAQAQECILEKSILDHRKAAITAKVAQQLVDFNSQCLQSLSFDSVISVLSSRRHKEWKRMCEMKRCYYQSIAYLSMGESADEGQRFGERLAWFNASVASLEESQKVAKDLKDDTVNETLRFAFDVIAGRQANAKKENDLIYTDRVPELHSLPEIRAASLVKGLGFEVSDKEISGPDIFRRLVPMATHAASSIYSEEKAKLLRKLTEEVEERNSWMDDFLNSLSIGSAHPVDVPVSQDLLDCCAQLRARASTSVGEEAGEGGQHKLSSEATDALRRLVDVSVEVQSSLRQLEEDMDEEAETQKAFAAAHPQAGQPPGESELTTVREETAELRTTEEEARNANMALRAALEHELKNVQRLMRPPAELVQELPSVRSITEDDASRKVLLEVARLLGVVEEMRAQRTKLIDQLRQDLLADDITQLLISGSGSAAAAGMERSESEQAAVYAEQLRKHDKVVEYLRQNMTAQGNVAKKMEEVYVQYAPIKKRLEEIDRNRREEMEVLCRTYGAYTTALEKAAEGVNFYERTSESLSRLSARLRRTLAARTSMREGHIAKVAAATAAAAPPAPAPAPAPTSNAPVPDASAPAMGFSPLMERSKTDPVPASDGIPRLKDFLPMMKPKTYGAGSRSDQAPPTASPPVSRAPAAVQPPVASSPQVAFTVPHQGEFPTAYAQGQPSYSSGRGSLPGTSTTGSAAASSGPPPSTGPASVTAAPADPNTRMFLPWFQEQQRWCYINAPGQAPVQYSIASQRSTVSQTFSSAGLSTGGTNVSYSVGVVPTSVQSSQFQAQQMPAASVSNSVGYQQPQSTAAYSGVSQAGYQHLYQQSSVQVQQQYHRYSEPALAYQYGGQRPPYQQPQQPPQQQPQQQSVRPPMQQPQAQQQQPRFPLQQQSQLTYPPMSSPPTQPHFQRPPQPPQQPHQQFPQPQQPQQFPQPQQSQQPQQPQQFSQPQQPQQHFSQFPQPQQPPQIPQPQQPAQQIPQPQQPQQQFPQLPQPQQPQQFPQPQQTQQQLPQPQQPQQFPQPQQPQRFPQPQQPQQPQQPTQPFPQAQQRFSQPQQPQQRFPQPQQPQQPQQPAQQFPQAQQQFPQSQQRFPQPQQPQQPQQQFSQPQQQLQQLPQPQQRFPQPQQPQKPQQQSQQQQPQQYPPAQPFGYNYPYMYQAHQQQSQQQPLQPNQQQPQQPQQQPVRQPVSQSLQQPQQPQQPYTFSSASQPQPQPQAPGYSVPGTSQPGYSSGTNQSSSQYYAGVGGGGVAWGQMPNGTVSAPNKSAPNGSASSPLAQPRQDLLSSSPLLPEATEGLAPDSAAVLTPKVLTKEELEEQHAEETQLRQLAAARDASRKDPLDDNLTLNTFIAEVERFFRRLAELERYDSGELYNAWKKMNDEAKAFPKKSMAIGRMYPMKNRFPEHVPFDENRVVLKDAKDDYINATHVDIAMDSLVDSACCPKFIVAQAPLPTTLSDFWTMILEQGCEVVAMLACPAVSDVPQNVRLPVHWPESKGEVKRFGCFEVLLQAQKEKEWWIERVLTIRRGNGLQTRTVVHLQFHDLLGAGGPRGGNPASTEGFASFAAEVRALYRQQRSPIKPIAVLCSSGSGVSGTLVSLYAAMLHVETTGRLPVLASIVLHLWKQRLGLLEDQEQLLLLHRALAHYANDLLVKRNIVVSSGRKSTAGRQPAHSTGSSSGDSLVAGRMPFTDIHSSVSRLTIPEGGGSAAEVSAIVSCHSTPSQEVPRPVSEPKDNKQPSPGGTLNELAASFTDLELSPAPTEKRRITKRDFLEARATGGGCGTGGLLTGPSTTDPTDPFAGIDPMWSLKK